MLELFDASLARAPQTEIVRYFDGTLTLAELDELSDAFAVALTDRGFAHGDRLATYLQNIPQALIAVVGTWKAGGIVVSINPMSRQRELTTLLTDCEATAIVVPGGPLGAGRGRGRPEHRGADRVHDLAAGVPDPRRTSGSSAA